MNIKINKELAYFVNCRAIDTNNRIACAMHSSLGAEEPHFVLVPINPLAAREIKAISIIYEDGEAEVVMPDKVSQSFVE